MSSIVTIADVTTRRHSSSQQLTSLLVACDLKTSCNHVGLIHTKDCFTVQICLRSAIVSRLPSVRSGLSAVHTRAARCCAALVKHQKRFTGAAQRMCEWPITLVSGTDHAAPAVWNDLPHELKEDDISRIQFKAGLEKWRAYL